MDKFVNFVLSETMETPIIHMAPLQGFTDFVYRRAYDMHFPGVDTYYIPYITVKHGKIPGKYDKEIKPVNNPQDKVVPQILTGNTEELSMLVDPMIGFGYRELNLNMGCPYPMVTRRNRGAGLLRQPERVKEILTAYFRTYTLPLSVKIRAGLESEKEIEKIIPILNEYPLSAVILHPRTANQLYKGAIHEQAFSYACKYLRHKIVYNGDINTSDDLARLKKSFPSVDTWMIGRGILMNPFLPGEIHNLTWTAEERQHKIIAFHNQLLEDYTEEMDNPGNALNKMKVFWSYFSAYFDQPHKTYKAIKKKKTMIDYKKEIGKLLRQQRPLN